MKDQFKIAALAMSVAATVTHAGTVNFSDRSWTTLDGTGNEPSGLNLNNTYTTPDANTGVIGARYGINNIMATDLTLGVGDSVSFDYYVTDNNPGYTPGAQGDYYFNTWEAVFWDTTSASSIHSSGNWVTARTASFNNHTQVTLNNGGNPLTISSDLSTGVHFNYTFGVSDYTITATSIANPLDTLALTRSYWTGGVGDIQSFSVNLYDSEQVATLANFTVTPAPEPGVISLLALGSGLGVLLMRRRRS